MTYLTDTVNGCGAEDIKFTEIQTVDLNQLEPLNTTILTKPLTLHLVDADNEIPEEDRTLTLGLNVNDTVMVKLPENPVTVTITDDDRKCIQP